MLDTLIFSLNATFPIFFLLVVGVILGNLKLFKDDFYRGLEKLAFNVTLPVMLFSDVSGSDMSGVMSVKFTVFIVIGICALFFGSWLIVPLFVKDKARRGAVVQGIYRSNIAIIGIPLLRSMFGTDGAALMASIMPFSIFLFNSFAVIVLSYYSPSENKQSLGKTLLDTLKKIMTNPLIVGIVLAIPFMLLKVDFPDWIDKSFDYLSDMTLPLAMISLGAGFKLSSLKGRIGTSFAVSLIKTVISPALFLFVAVMLGFRNVYLGATLAVFGGPVAVASYIMARNMGSDHELAGQILVLSTVLGSITLFGYIFLLRSLGLL